jgi:mRNA deadenylase 3'-5' endonuclease subunit Ccr4
MAESQKSVRRETLEQLMQDIRKSRSDILALQEIEQQKVQLSYLFAYKRFHVLRDKHILH